MTIDPDSGKVCWNITVSNIADATQSHMHVGAAGVSGDVVVPLDVDGFEGSTQGCVEGQDKALLAKIIANPAGYYANVHTADFKPGAVRGQLAAGAPKHSDGAARQLASCAPGSAAAAARCGLRRSAFRPTDPHASLIHRPATRGGPADRGRPFLMSR